MKEVTFNYYSGGLYDFIINHKDHGTFVGYFSGKKTAVATPAPTPNTEDHSGSAKFFGPINCRLLDDGNVEVVFSD